MKFSNLSILVTCFVSTTSFAFPTVGDFATYSVTQVTNNQTASGEITTTVKSIDQENDLVTIATTTNGNPDGDYSQALSEMMSMYNLIDQCSAIGGAAEVVAAANSSFPTCRIHQDLSGDEGNVIADIWFAKVPFSIVKSVVVQDTKAGQMTQTMLLKAFKNQ